MITREEYELLIGYRAIGYKWIARDKNKMLYVYSHKPLKVNSVRYTSSEETSYNYISYSCHADIFKSITWEDEKPTKIDDLIRDYEAHQVIVGEKAKVVIPQFVADWIAEVKGLTRNFKLELLFNTVQMPDDVYDWLDERYGDTDILAKAWLDGFVVEKEKLYTVQLKNGYHLCKYEGIGIKWLNMTEFNTVGCYKLTQAEIESVDPRLMQFAVEVE